MQDRKSFVMCLDPMYHVGKVGLWYPDDSIAIVTSRLVFVPGCEENATLAGCNMQRVETEFRHTDVN